MNKFGKILLPFITPFNHAEEVDYPAFEQLIQYAFDRKLLDSVIVTGTTGEFNTLTFEERVRLFETAVKAVAGRAPIVAGTGCASTRETVALTNAAVKAGINTCMVVAPYYCKPNQRGIYEHYMRVLRETTADILIYNIPIFTGVNVEPATVAALAAQSRRFIGIKDESGLNPVQLLDYRAATRAINPDFLLFNGDDVMLMSTICLGADGIVSGGALLIGDRMRRIFELYEEGRNAEALHIFDDLFRLCRCFCDTRLHPNPKLRAAVEIVSGIEVGPARMPLDQPDASELEQITELMKALALV